MKLQRTILLSMLPSALSFQSGARWIGAGAATRSSTTTTTTTTTTTVRSGKGDDNNDHEEGSFEDRRSFVGSLFAGAAAAIATTGTVLPTSPANAGIDPSLLRNYGVEGDASGIATRLRQIEEVQRPASDTVNKEYEKLPSGVEYREYREGKGEAVIQSGSKIAAQITIRAQSFSTANEPGGVKYFSTKTDTDFDELAWTVGSGELPAGLEEAMMGMHRNGLRRIVLPSTQVFAARDGNQLPLPTTKDGKRVFDRLFKTDATLLFEVLVTSVKNPQIQAQASTTTETSTTEASATTDSSLISS